MNNKLWLSICGMCVALGVALGWWLHKPISQPVTSDWWNAPQVPGVETRWQDRWKTKERVVTLPGATVTIVKDGPVTIQKGSTVFVKDCPKIPRVVTNRFAVEAGAGLMRADAPQVGYEASFEYMPVGVNFRGGQARASLYLKAEAQMYGDDRRVDGSITAGVRIEF